MSSHLRIESLSDAHLDELAHLLAHPRVYAFIEQPSPDAAQIRQGLEHALRGPRGPRSDEKWLNFLVREAASGAVIGRLEATVHHGLAEVAFLFGPSWWGKGYATQGLEWLHEHLRHAHAISDCWATTVAANVHCQALLRRCGYALAAAGRPVLYSYDEGDLVFNRCAA